MQTGPIEVKDAKYHWRYEMSLFRNPTIFLAVAKALLLALAVTMFLLGLVTVMVDGFSADNLLFTGKLTLIMLGIFAALLVLGYLLYAAIMGGSYIVDFTMNEKTIVHTQSAKQAKKAEQIGTAAMLMGLFTRNRGAVSAGYNSATRIMTTVELHLVKKVITDKKRSTIKLRSVGWDHVYADGEDFDFVAEWIRAHIPENAEWVVRS